MATEPVELDFEDLRARRAANEPWVRRLVALIENDPEIVRTRPRDPQEWDWLKAMGVPERLLGPRWEGPGPVPRWPPGKGPPAK